MMREVVIDTETTGLDPQSGDRVVEIGCVELINHVPTGQTFHRYVNPERSMPSAAERIHGLSEAFLADMPKFAEVADDFLSFVEEGALVIHNAQFDLGFLNNELERLRRPPIPHDRAIDTVGLARRKFPGAPASLDALCRRFDIDNSARTKHGALLDAELLAEVYLELIGGRQPGFVLVETHRETCSVRPTGPTVRPPRPHGPSEGELEAHAELVAELDDPVWNR